MDAIDRLRNLRTAEMTDHLDLPTAPEIMHRAQQRRQRRRIAATVGGLAASAAAIGAVIGIALRDDTDEVRTIDEPPRTTVTLDPTTSPTTDPTTTTTDPTTTTSTTGQPAGTLKPADSQTPVAGTCGFNETPVAEAEMFPDVPGPRCLQVLADQKLRLTNRLTVPITVDFGDFHTVIQPDQAYLFDRPFGDYLAMGVHRMTITHDQPDANSTGPEIWLIDESQGP